jgi:predicted amidohydrolase
MAKIGVLQMTSGIDPAVNAATLVDAIRDAVAAGVEMLFTPEMSGLIDRDRARAANSIVAEDNDPVLAAVRDGAASAGIWVHLGSLAVRRADGKFANRGFVIDPSGAIRARYDKLHLFDVAAAQTGVHEDGRETHGHSLVIDPWGDVLLDMGEGAGLAFAEIDVARIEEVRSRIPVLAHRRTIPPVSTVG